MSATCNCGQTTPMEALPESDLFEVRRVCIIGAGPTGLAAAKYLLAENAFDKIDVFEQQPNAGGVWNYTKDTRAVVVPQVTPHVPLEQPLGHNLIFPTAMYEKLHSNIPKSLMQFHDKKFPDESQLFPTRETILEYIREYAEDIKHLISYSTQVQEVKLQSESGKDTWKIKTKDLVNSKNHEAEYDAVIVASGHYSVPYIPNALGIGAWNEAYPGAITHGKFYRNAAPYHGKKVIVVGNHASGSDVSKQVMEVSAKPLLNSVVHKDDKPLPDYKKEVEVIEEYIIEDRAVRFADGRVEKNIDAVIYCTGYFYSFPFLESLEPAIVSDGRRALGTYKHLFNSAHPTLAFTVLVQKVIPFPTSEAQGAIIARVWSNRLELPTREAMDTWEKRTVAQRGEGTAFHILGWPLDGSYINEMSDWAWLADGDHGKKPPRWDDKMLWVRERYLDILKAFVDNGGTAKILEELGFDFEAHETEGKSPCEQGA